MTLGNKDKHIASRYFYASLVSITAAIAGAITILVLATTTKDPGSLAIKQAVVTILIISGAFVVFAYFAIDRYSSIIKHNHNEQS